MTMGLDRLKFGSVGTIRWVRVVAAIGIILAIAGAATYLALSSDDPGSDGGADTIDDNSTVPTPTGKPPTGKDGPKNSAGQPIAVACEADAGGNRVTWEKAQGATKYYVYRSVEGGAYAYRGSATSPAYFDNATAHGNTYKYVITAGTWEGESGASEACEVTAVPIFSTVAVLALAIVAGVGVYVSLRMLRRRHE